MNVNLSQKEQMLLKDLKSHEEWCIKKYTTSEEKASDPTLKTLFADLRTAEEQHLNTINQILAGTVPNMSQSSQSSTGQNQNYWSKPTAQSNVQADIDLCQDLLNNEKYVSSVYDTVIFECTQKEVRNALNHIQKEEQEHGEKLFNYMHQHGGYQVQ